MIVIDIFVPGEPVGKGRPRFSRKNGVAFTPAKTRSYEGIVRQFAAENMAMHNLQLIDRPIELRLSIQCAIPESWPAWKKELAITGKIAPTSRPDADNVEKAIKDALNLVVWRDDAYVVSASKLKVYSSTPGVLVLIDILDTYPCQITKRPHG